MEQWRSKEELSWSKTPREGLHMAVVFGDPSKHGLYTIRLVLLANHQVPLHTHPEDEYLCIIDGRVTISVGNGQDRQKKMNVGDCIWLPSLQPHAASTDDTPVTMHIYASGPRITNYIPTKTQTIEHKL
jgi:quercetin dioxygenase-like cupin family protein